MSGTEQRALEALKQAARAYERETNGRFAETERPTDETPLIVGARLRMAARVWARAEREAKKGSAA